MGVGALAISLLVPALASGSVLIAEKARQPTLKVGANGDAEVVWTNARGARQRLLVPFKGLVRPGERIQGANVAWLSKRWKLPFKPILKKAPNGFFYALQTWRPRPGKPAELRLSRWKGKPTQLELGADLSGTKESLSGSVVFRKKPVYGTSPSPGGLPMKIYVLVDCRECAARPQGGWTRVVGLRLKKADGTFSLNVRPLYEGSRYRAQLAGPNRGRHLAPDVRAIVASARPPT